MAKDEATLRNGEDGADRLLSACYTELQCTRYELENANKENQLLRKKIKERGLGKRIAQLFKGRNYDRHF